MTTQDMIRRTLCLANAYLPCHSEPGRKDVFTLVGFAGQRDMKESENGTDDHGRV